MNVNKVAPVVPLDERKPFRERTQQAFYRSARYYELINCRKTFNCQNAECRKEIRSYSNYYFKYKGSKDWTFRYYNIWDKVCQDCYYDHVLDPATEEWQNQMAHRLDRQGKNLDYEREQAGLPRSVPLSFQASRRR